MAAAAPLVICLACGAEDQPRRLGEISDLAEALGGRACAQSVSGRTVAIRIAVPESNAARFASALALAGATLMDATPDVVATAAGATDVLVLLTREPPHTEGALS